MLESFAALFSWIVVRRVRRTITHERCLPRLLEEPLHEPQPHAQGLVVAGL